MDISGLACSVDASPSTKNVVFAPPLTTVSLCQPSCSNSVLPPAGTNPTCPSGSTQLHLYEYRLGTIEQVAAFWHGLMAQKSGAGTFVVIMISSNSANSTSALKPTKSDTNS
jgi:hypothetical protein